MSLLHCFWRCSLILHCDLVGGADVVGVDVVESDVFGDGLGGGGYLNEEPTEPYGPIETYLSK